MQDNFDEYEAEADVYLESTGVDYALYESEEYGGDDDIPPHIQKINDEYEKEMDDRFNYDCIPDSFVTDEQILSELDKLKKLCNKDHLNTNEIYFILSKFSEWQPCYFVNMNSKTDSIEDFFLPYIAYDHFVDLNIGTYSTSGDITQDKFQEINDTFVSIFKKIGLTATIPFKLPVKSNIVLSDIDFPDDPFSDENYEKLRNTKVDMSVFDIEVPETTESKKNLYFNKLDVLNIPQKNNYEASFIEFQEVEVVIPLLSFQTASDICRMIDNDCKSIKLYAEAGLFGDKIKSFLSSSLSIKADLLTLKQYNKSSTSIKMVIPTIRQQFNALYEIPEMIIPIYMKEFLSQIPLTKEVPAEVKPVQIRNFITGTGYLSRFNTIRFDQNYQTLPKYLVEGFVTGNWEPSEELDKYYDLYQLLPPAGITDEYFTYKFSGTAREVEDKVEQYCNNLLSEISATAKYTKRDIIVAIENAYPHLSPQYKASLAYGYDSKANRDSYRQLYKSIKKSQKI